MPAVIFVAALVISSNVVGSAWATSFTGCLGTSDIGVSSCDGATRDGLLSGTDGWATGATFSWEVNDSDNPGYWTYNYWFKVTEKDLSHIIIETSDFFTLDDVVSLTTNPGLLASGGVELQTHNPSDSGNPNLPESFFGLKLNIAEGATALEFHATLVTPKNPVWGDVYAKDGRDKEGVFASLFNQGFTSPDFDPSNPPANGSVSDHVLVPDTVAAPEPTTALLLGSGLLGLLGLGRRRFFGKS